MSCGIYVNALLLLYNTAAKMPKNAEVYLCKDWEMLDEDNCLCDLYRLNDVCKQCVFIDDGLDFVDIDEVILCFDEERAK